MSARHTKFIFVTGGVVSSIGKGLAAASMGALLEARGLKVEHAPLSDLPAPYNRLHVVVATKAES